MSLKLELLLLSISAFLASISETSSTAVVGAFSKVANSSLRALILSSVLSIAELLSVVFKKLRKPSSSLLIFLILASALTSAAGASSACCVFCISFNAAISLSPTNVTTRCSSLASGSYLSIACNTPSTVAIVPGLAAALSIVLFTLISTPILPSASIVPVNSTGPLAN